MEQDEQTGLALATTPAEVHAIRAINTVASMIVSTTWGKDMPDPMRRAYAEYCRRYDVDPVTEMDNLGGTPYVNADWFKRKLGELRMAGIIKAVRLEHIHADRRLDALRKDESAPEEIRAEASRQWFDAVFKRVKHNAPETATAICVCTIVLADGSEIVGCKWAGNGTSTQQSRRGGGFGPNPIAESNPVLTVESGAIRRAAIQLFSHLTGQQHRTPAPDPASMRTDYKRIAKGVMSDESVARVEATYAASDEGREPAPKMITASADGAYGLT